MGRKGVSYTELFPVGADGDIHQVFQISNSWGGGMAVWMALSAKYVPEYGDGTGGMMEGYKKLFDLLKTDRLNSWERIVLLTTCDGAMVKAENFAKVAEAMETFFAEYKPALEGRVFHLDRQANYLRKLDGEREEKGWRAVGWNQTSVNGNCPWYGSYDDDENHTPYNLDKQDTHWWVMDDAEKSSVKESPPEHVGV